MDKPASAGNFYLRLAWGNLRRNQRTALPFVLAGAVMSGVYLLISGLLFSETLRNMPTGGTASAIFGLGLFVFTVFTILFMVYINRFLVSRRKGEFGLYGILGMNKGDVTRVLLLENLIITLLGLALGTLLALVFGRMVFWVLLRVIRAVPGSTFSLAPRAFLLTYGLFACIYLVNAIISMRLVRLTSPAQLMESSRVGEKESRFLWPVTICAILVLGTCYGLAWSLKTPIVALYVFFLLVIPVIGATFLLFRSGSIALLKSLRKNKRLYYTPEHFVSISGMFQRMQQNARGLSAITILSTMLVVSVSGTLALYLGQEKMLSGMYPYDVCVYTVGNTSEKELRQFEDKMLELAAEQNVTLSADPSKITTTPPENERFLRDNYMPEGARQVPLGTLLYFDNGYRFDAEGDLTDCANLIGEIRGAYREYFSEVPSLIASDVFTAKQEGYGLYGGLLFLGAFFGLLFLCITVLLIYFKQISEGFEDRERFVILQQVGMDDELVRSSINRQVLLVFFAPLAATVLHMLFASRIMARMLETLMLYDWGLVFGCIGIVLGVFLCIYLAVYRITAKAYYSIVRW